jgi:hypothetical protein
MYEGAHGWIWPDTPSSVITEPARLSNIIHTVKPDDEWLSAMGDGGGVPRSKHGDGDDVGDGPAEVRYIDLSSHPQLLEFSQLLRVESRHGRKATFVVRDEYTRFIQHALSLLLSDDPLLRFFVAGQPGIRKSSALLWVSRSGIASDRQVSWYSLFLPVPPRSGKARILGARGRRALLHRPRRAEPPHPGQES